MSTVESEVNIPENPIAILYGTVYEQTESRYKYKDSMSGNIDNNEELEKST